MKDKDYYEKLFIKYPDVVTLLGLRKMLGGIGDFTARKLMQKDYIIRDAYFIPKSCIIDYVLGKHYAEYKKTLKHHI